MGTLNLPVGTRVRDTWDHFGEGTIVSFTEIDSYLQRDYKPNDWNWVKWDKYGDCSGIGNRRLEAIAHQQASPTAQNNDNRASCFSCEGKLKKVCGCGNDVYNVCTQCGLG